MDSDNEVIGFTDEDKNLAGVDIPTHDIKDEEKIAPVVGAVDRFVLHLSLSLSCSVGWKIFCLLQSTVILSRGGFGRISSYFFLSCYTLLRIKVEVEEAKEDVERNK